MTILEAVKQSAFNLQLENIANINSESEVGGLNDSDKLEFDNLIRCAHQVLKEIAAEYVPLVTNQSFNLTNNEIDFKDFCKPILEVIRVSFNGKRIPFVSFHDRIELGIKGGGNFTVEYAYDIDFNHDLNAELDYKSKKVSVRLLGFGIAAEYCLINGMNDEAILWDRRYKDALGAAVSQRKEKKVKVRRWL